MARASKGTVRIEQKSEVDQLGRARWLVQWFDGPVSRGQIFHTTRDALLAVLARNGFANPLDTTPRAQPAAVEV